MAQIDLKSLRERIKVAPNLSEDERKLILGALALSEYPCKHSYPASFKPGTDPWSACAFELLDQLPANAMTTNHRYMLAGLIAGALQAVAERGVRSGEHRRL